MPKPKKKLTEAEKKRIIARGVKVARRYVKPSKPVKKAKSRMSFSDAIAGLNKKVKRFLKGEKKKNWLATKDKERQLRRSLEKRDIEKLRDKKKNTHHKKSGGY